MRPRQITPRGHVEAEHSGADRSRRRRRRFHVRRLPGSLARHVLLVAVAVALLLPFYWMIISALKDSSQIFARPIQWWPTPVRWDNFTRALHYPGFPFFRFLGNSVFYAGSVSLGTVLSSAAVGYGFACLRFPGRDLLFGLTVSTMLIPGIVLFIPTFVLFKHLGLLGTYAPLIGPAFLGNAFFIFLLRQFFRGLPQDLADARAAHRGGDPELPVDLARVLRAPHLLSGPQSIPAIAGVVRFSGPAHDRVGPPDGGRDARHDPTDRHLLPDAAVCPVKHDVDRHQRLSGASRIDGQASAPALYSCPGSVPRAGGRRAGRAGPSVRLSIACSAAQAAPVPHTVINPISAIQLVIAASSVTVRSATCTVQPSKAAVS
jgi:ABC-type sulfate transport system permease component